MHSMARSTDICPLCVASENGLLDGGDEDGEVTWIQCTKCNQWFHIKCLKIPDYEIGNFVSYHCSKCSQTQGPSVLKRKSKRSRISIDYVALNEGETIAIDKSSHFQLSNFLEFKGSPDISIQDHLTKADVINSKILKPVLIPQADLSVVGMELPLNREDLTVDFITQCCGEDMPVEVMDVISQQSVSPAWKLNQWRKYFNTDPQYRDRIRNVISLEISKVAKLGTGFKRPQMVRDMDIVDKVWDPNDDQERSKVTKYCLMSVKDCYTDFHIDFGGTSVYYTVLKGCKTFLMFPPSDINLELYTSWCLEPKQNFIWFPEYSVIKNKKRVFPSGGFKITLQPGDLFIIPSGWIHSVHTPQDSVVYGGNYLTLKDMTMQLKIYDVETKTKVPAKFRFPMFNKVIWLSAAYYYAHEQELLEDAGSKEVALQVLNSWIKHLERHHELSKSNQVAKRSIPKQVGNPSEFICQLQVWKDKL
ncbi:JHD1 [Candida oxycetoniae]|uniref:JmjC domain-containing histone demethylation protein 1 n=1 Tax=Candida oxycetoniae TaxID=497107 RepID=A0AAI9STM3_9ASCO|nr:JHD1 [Candida oxycetoniae]KAI3402810.2 JHD1 [Candida oxycetoniae]